MHGEANTAEAFQVEVLILGVIQHHPQPQPLPRTVSALETISTAHYPHQPEAEQNPPQETKTLQISQPPRETTTPPCQIET